MTELEQRFHAAMLRIYERAKAECGYNASYFIRMVHERGGVGTAKRLLAGESVQYGLTKLWECQRLDLSVEAHVLKAEFERLFSDEEKAMARARLDAYGYSPQP